MLGEDKEIKYLDDGPEYCGYHNSSHAECYKYLSGDEKAIKRNYAIESIVLLLLLCRIIKFNYIFLFFHLFRI